MDGGGIVMRKVIRKCKVNGLRHQMPWICWVFLFSMFFMLCMDKGSYLNLYLMITSNYVVIVIMLMCIYVYICMYVCRFLRGLLGIMIILF